MNVGIIYIYYNGDPLPQNDFRKHRSHQFPLQVFTILNVTKTAYKCVVAYLYSILVVAPMGFWMILYFLNKFPDS